MKAKSPEAAIDLAMTALKDAGISPENVVIAVVGRRGQAATFVGRQRKQEGGANLAVISRRLLEEATDQAMALRYKAKCPSCRSPRFGPTVRDRANATCLECGAQRPVGLPR